MSCINNKVRINNPTCCGAGGEAVSSAAGAAGVSVAGAGSAAGSTAGSAAGASPAGASPSAGAASEEGAASPSVGCAPSSPTASYRREYAQCSDGELISVIHVLQSTERN